MAHLEASMANTCLPNPSLDYSAQLILAISTNFGTWMILILALAVTLWRFRGVRVFCIGFVWRGTSAQVRVMLQSSSCPSFSASGNGGLKKIDGAIDDLKMYRTVNVGDLEVPREHAISEKGCHRNESKSFSLCDSLILCDARDSDSLCSSGSMKTEMVVVFEKSLGSYSPCNVRKSVIASPLRSLFQKQVLRFPSLTKWECVTDNPGHNQVSVVEEFRCRGIVHSRRLHESPSLSSLELIFQGGEREKSKGFWFAFNHDNEEQKGEKLWMLDPFVGFCKWKGVELFEGQNGLNKLWLVKSSLARNESGGGFGLTAHICPECFIQKPNHTKVWQVNCEKVLGINEDVGNVVRLWDVEVAKCLNESLIKDSLLMVNHIKNGYENESLCSGIVTRREKASFVVWDSRVFAKPVSYRLGNQPSFQKHQLIDNESYSSDALNNAVFDLRMSGATPIEVCPVL